MKPWYKITTELGAYNYEASKDESHHDDYHISIKDNISPLSELFLDLYSNLINEKNLIVSYPDNVFRLISIMSFIYALNYNKSVIVFTSHHKDGRFNKRSLKDYHNLNYCMLSRYGSYVFYSRLIGFIRNNTLKIDIKFPKSANKRRTKEIKQSEIMVRLENEEPKVLLFTEDELKIIEDISDVLIDSKSSTLKDTSLDIGLVIFENVDLYVNSRFTAEKFLKWIKKYQERGIRCLFHFSNPNSKFIEVIKKETDSFVIPINSDLLSKTYLKNESKNYFSNLTNYPMRQSIINNYNVDSKNFLDDEGVINKNHIQIHEQLIESGNFKFYYSQGKNILKNINQRKVVNKRLFRISKKLFYSFMELSVNPLRYKVKYCEKEGECKYYRTLDFLDIFKNRLYKESDSLTQELLGDFLDSLISITFELGRSKHYGEDNSFNKVGKEYLILDIAKNKKKYFKNDNDLIICCYNSIEVSLLENELNRFNIQNVIVKNIHWLNKSLLDNKSEYNLLLPGAVPLKYFSELFMPYAKILILSYDGYNFEKISKELDSISNINNIQNSKRLNYFKEIYEFLNEQNSQLIEDLENNIDVEEEIPEETSEEILNNSEDYISSIIKNIFKTSEFKEDFDVVEKIEKEIAKESFKSKIDDGKSVEFKLKNTETGEVIYKKLPLNNSFSYLDDENNLLEGSPNTIGEGNYLIFIDNDDKKSLLEFIIEIYDLDLAIDKNTIEYWKIKVMDYFLSKNMKYTEFNREFNNIGGNRTIPATTRWVKGEVLGPKEVNDLYLIGKLLDDELILDNYEYMFEEIEKIRNIHRLTGKRLNNVIKQIMGAKGNINQNDLDYMGQLFYDKIKNGIYEVLEKSG